jgi:hypothetical protein
VNLRKDHYRLLVFTDLLTRLTPSGLGSNGPFLGVSARLPKLATSQPGQSDLLSAAVGRDGPRCRGTVPLLLLLEQRVVGYQ